MTTAFFGLGGLGAGLAGTAAAAAPATAAAVGGTAAGIGAGTAAGLGGAALGGAGLTAAEAGLAASPALAEGVTAATPAVVGEGMTPAMVAAEEGMAAPSMAPELANARMSDVMNPPGVTSPSDVMGKLGQGDVMGVATEPLTAPLEPITGLLGGGSAPPMPKPVPMEVPQPAQLTPSAPQVPQVPATSLLNQDWAGMAEKAKSFTKMANSVQDFTAKMKGQDQNAQKMSQAAPQLPQSQPAKGAYSPAPLGPPPATRLSQAIPANLLEARLRQLRGY